MLIALLTDFGTEDYFVGAMKGVILSINSGAKIIDITHDIPPQNIQSAGFTLASCYQNFPLKTIFVAVVDPGVGSERRAILVETENYYFIAPDNSLLNLILENEKNYRVIELTNQAFFNQPVSQTFHGRDIFAPVAAWISKGVKPSEFGKEIKDLIIDDSLNPQKISANEIEGRIIHIDHFGNLITNFRKEDLSEKFTLKVNKTIISKHLTFFAKAKEELFSIWGSAEYLEVVSYQHSAKSLLKIEVGERVIAKLL